jgi:transcriptional regulator with XRE-family HTH domain
MTKLEIKILLLQKGINQTELAQRIGVSPQVLCDILAGRRKALSHRKAIAKVLKLSIDNLLG